jgi:hypothetical protein
VNLAFILQIHTLLCLLIASAAPFKILRKNVTMCISQDSILLFVTRELKHSSNLRCHPPPSLLREVIDLQLLLIFAECLHLFLFCFIILLFGLIVELGVQFGSQLLCYCLCL